MRTHPLALLALSLTLACTTGKGSVEGELDTGPDVADGSDGSDGTTDATGCDLEGQAFLVDFAAADVVEPPNIGALLVSQLNGDVLLQIEGQSDTEIGGMIGFSVEGAQDLCAETATLPTSAWADPTMQLGPQDVTLNFAGAPVSLSSFYLSIDVADDCGSLIDGVSTAELDARLLNPVVEPVFGTEDADALCETLAGFDVVCGACTSDGAPYCAPLLIEALGGPAVDTVLVQVTEGDVAANPDCR